MAEVHWDCMFPPAKRMRARQTAYVWLAEKAGLILAEKVPAANESAVVIEAAELLKKLDNTLVDKMGDQAPLLTDLSRPLKNYQQSAKAEQERSAQPEVQTPPPQQPEAGNQPVATPSPEAAPVPPQEPTNNIQPVEQKPVARKPAAAPAIPSGAIESEGDSKKSLRQLQAASRDIAAFWVNQKLSDPRSYRLTRVAAWMVVENAPPANEGVTQILPPAAERLKFFETTLQKAEYSTLVVELEKTLARSPFWLDGHFLVVKALRALGAEYDKAVKTVIRETANFLNRLPEVMELSFSDQTPFASDQTRMWLDAEVLTSSAAGDSAGASTGDAANSWDVALVEAGKKAASGETEQAVSIMQQGLQQAGQQRDQMYWRCALAQLLMQLGDAVPAANILEQICMQLDEEQLSIWEPKLLAHTYNLLFQSYQKQSKKNKDDKGLKENIDKAYEKLCWFDPVTALSVKGG
ncbi:MAG: type VI secretion system protein TssA [Gammaproteobacteria bacterium]|jgi:type VI secretion system protein VasJ|nr:type VI secretion system protein TssA [Gammaproteobacteria bacterium]MBT4195056.1 type VI secretion system protein TssA [Gammaproteobacteria bacterium]MBT4860439.1 type VI secretion system protein TssA [Gammaproteobacteria bacterium]MBT7046827.1 type VI secretion system protein TssA [Gammaproteobacteria bacterium]